jgi:hypothetical protein
MRGFFFLYGAGGGSEEIHGDEDRDGNRAISKQRFFFDCWMSCNDKTEEFFEAST